MPRPRSADFTDFDSWHPSGWSPVYDRVTSLRHLVGFTTQQSAVDRLIIEQETGDDDGAFKIVAEARVELAGTDQGDGLHASRPDVVDLSAIVGLLLDLLDSAAPG